MFRIDPAAPTARFAGSVCAFGVFDGVHKGHRYLLERACADAREQGAPFIVLTFDIDPDERFHPDRLKKLLSNEDRLALLESFCDEVAVIPFTESFAALSPERFLDTMFCIGSPCSLHVGNDIRFGARAQGTIDDLLVWGEPHGMNVRAHELLSLDGRPVTATRIRLLLEQGKIEQANELLGYRYALRAPVLAGRGEGASMGFRTANLVVPDLLRVLGDGVYAAYASVEGKRYKAAVSVGVAPTFENARATVEAHLLDFDGDLYGKEIVLQFVNWLRPMRKFDSIEELIATVQGNIEWVRTNL